MKPKRVQSSKNNKKDNENYMLNEKAIIILLKVGLIKKIQYK